MGKATTNMKKSKTGGKPGAMRSTRSPRIIASSEALIDWRVEMLARIRRIILKAAPDVVEEIKWRKPSNSMRGVPVWSYNGIICTGETYKDSVKMTFAKGAALKDPIGLFNSSLEGNTRRAIDFHEGDKIDENAIQALIRAAAMLNTSAETTSRPTRTAKKALRN